MTNIVVQPEVIKKLANCVVDVITNKIDWSAIDWQAVAEKAYQRTQGEWIKNEGKDIRDNFYTCSKCGRTVNILCGETLADYPFCHCGADMRGDKNE